MAPERKVIDDYDISGYFTKVELSEQKLYTLVKSGVRQWFTSWYSLMTEASNSNLIIHSSSRKDFLEAIGWFGEPGPNEGEGVTGFLFDKELVISDYPDQIKPLYDRLDVLKPLIRTPEGHKLAMDDMGNILVKTVKTKATADYYYVAESAMVMPRLLLDLTFKSGLVFSTLWKKITDAEKAAAVAKPAKSRGKKAAKAAKSIKKPVKKVAKKATKKKR
jgi:hypothetical protein